ncbi:alkylated DNA repair protein [Vigna unguiculata]|uniref:DNA N(6)-methyladenine demethylase n=1 Tax=Vigna unguiculata TaxID=3917 RepID=A0A4D6NL65_VIGUN|nr:alkylated DNA repair protein [Vigna unguiculata]
MEPFGGGHGRVRGRGRGRGRRSPSTSPVVVGNEQCARGRGSEEKKQPQNSSPDSRSDSDSVGMGMSKLNIGDDVDKPSAAAASVGEGGFDICPRKQPGSVVLKPPLLVQNREKRRSGSSNNNGNGLSLRPGMVLLKGYLSLNDQQKIVERCRELGVGVGGFYQPGYGEETKMHLKMMCLGKNWDPHTSQYGERRPFDGAKSPHIPPEFQTLVSNALRDSNALVPQNRLPSISPDICIVNFYSQTGRLGLHQDKDESEDSLRRGLPVVSFSIGDSALFLYGDHRDPDKAEKLQLESGDVLIFGGPSRNVFHGVTAIHPNSAPNLLLQHTNLRPGRLNLTFRQY